MPKLWEPKFPNLADWQETSSATRIYNCYAFAVGEDFSSLGPAPPNIYYWPANVKRSYELDSFVRAFSTEGFASCSDGSLVDGIEKLAMYVDRQGEVLHAARQLSDGRWTSKIGEDEDIVHALLDQLAGDEYGQPTHFMQRPKKNRNS